MLLLPECIATEQSRSNLIRLRGNDLIALIANDHQPKRSPNLDMETHTLSRVRSGVCASGLATVRAFQRLQFGRHRFPHAFALDSATIAALTASRGPMTGPPCNLLKALCLPSARW